MKKLLYVTLFVFAMVLAGCQSNKNEDRFQLSYKQRIDERSIVFIITDNETNVKYVYYKHGTGGGLTTLVEQ